MTTVNVRFGPLAEAIDHVASSHQTLSQHKDDLDRFLTHLRGTWEGDAGQTWQQVQDDWNRAYEDVVMVLRNLHVALDAAHGNYTGAEKGLRQMWGGS
jgi:WXG100 family type VII secretion target